MTQAVSPAIRVEAAPLKALRGVRHGFFGRWGGESSGIYADNNCGFGSKDDAVQVERNRARCIATLGLATLVTVHQRHTPDVVVVREPWNREAAPVADALVTDRPGLALGILTADCAPVLFADETAGVVAAAHAGWRGAFDGVVEATVAAMAALGANRAHIAAAVGPCIGQPSYEVGDDFRTRFIARDAGYERYFISGRPGHAQFDLPEFVANRLRAARVGSVAVLGRDTCAEDQHFFSYRRSVLRQEPDYGRQISVIGRAG